MAPPFQAMPPRPVLPIDAVLPELVQGLAAEGVVVLEAPPGAGKTTRVPAAILDAGVSGEREILVAEPRRLAARLSAHRVAEERGERVGQCVGFSIRYEEVSSAHTRIRYVTEGILLRRLVSDPKLEQVSVVVLDEFHERQLATDLALALLVRLRQTARPDLKLVVMSATLDAEGLALYLGRCRRVQSQGRVFPVQIEYLPAPDERPLEKQVASAVRQAILREPSGDVLVFLPGAGEIRKAHAALGKLAEEAHLAVHPLYSELPFEEQLVAVRPTQHRKVVLATNVAETSITIDGVTAVIDSGLARIADHSAWSGLPRLRLGKISRASATQRAGRAGRTREGRVLRLYTKGDYESRAERDLPEIRRADLSEMVLLLEGSGIGHPDTLGWLEAPEPSALAAAQALLRALGALSEAGTITDVGRRMLRFPVHPRLGRLIVEGERRGVASEACAFAALLSERDIALDERSAGRAADASRVSGPSDLLDRLERLEEARAEHFAPHRLRALGLDARRTRAADRALRQLERIARPKGDPSLAEQDTETALGLCVLSAFPDRLARRRRPGQRDLILANGSVARLSETSVVQSANLLLAVEVEEQQQSGRGSAAIVRMASAVEPEWLLELCSDSLEEMDELVYNATLGRVERITRMALGSVVLDETRAAAKPSPEASRLLARAALESAWNTELDALGELARRSAFLGAALPELALPPLDETTRLALVERAAEGRTTLAELSEVSLAAEYWNALTPAEQRALREQAPERITLPGGRSVPVHYEAGKPPWIASRLQDFFGMQSTPSIAQGRVPLTVQLLAPNQRAVQVTSDLAGFWARHYPALRRELMRRYPRHAWPEDPLTAKPPEPVRRSR